jgi:hypothetical protein
MLIRPLNFDMVKAAVALRHFCTKDEAEDCS